MTGRLIAVGVLVVLTGVNTWSGIAKIRTHIYRETANQALLETQMNLAMDQLLGAVSALPDDPQSYIQMGDLLGRTMASGDPLLKYAEKDPEDSFGIAVAAMGNAIARNPADPYGWFNMATLYQTHRSSRSRETLMRLAGESVRSPEAAARYAELTRPRVGLDPEDVVTIAGVRMAIELHPDAHSYHDYLARLYWDRGFKEEAGKEIRRGFALTPRLEAHKSVLEDEEMREGLAGDILAGIEDSTADRFIGPVHTVRARAEMLSKLDRHEEAIAAFNELRAVGGEELAAECDLELGKLEQQRERWRESIPMLERAASADGGESPWATYALWHLGRAHVKLGNEERGLEYFREFMGRAPMALEGYLSTGETLEALGRDEEAEAVYIAAARKFPRIPETYRRVVAIMRKNGKNRQAIPWAEGLRKLDPTNESVERLMQELGGLAGSQ